MQLHKIRRIITTLVPALFLVLALNGCKSRDTRANDSYVAAQQLVASGAFGAAGVELRRAVTARDDIPEIWLLLGQVEQRNGNIREAFIAFTRADEIRPSNPDILRAVSYTGYIVNATTESASATDRLLGLLPNDAEGLAIKGLLALDRNDIPTAMQASDAILRGDPTNETGTLLKSRALAVSGDGAAARALVTSALARGEQGGLRYILLQIDRADGNTAGMKETFPQLLKAGAQDSDLFVDYANMLYRTGDPVNARRVLADGMVKERRNGPYLAWAFALLDRFEPTNVPPVLDPRIAKAPPSSLRTAAARYLLDRGDAKGAGALVAPEGMVAPADRGTYAAALDAQGRKREAQAIVDELLVAGKSLDPEALVLRAGWALAAGNADRAINDSQNAVVADPTHVGARLMLSRAYAVSGSPSRARQVISQAMNDLPANRRIHAALLDFLYKSGDTAAIQGAVRAFAEANQSDPGSWAMLGKVCQEQGNTACVASAQEGFKFAQSNLAMPNPSRPNAQRGLFSPIKRKR